MLLFSEVGRDMSRWPTGTVFRLAAHALHCIVIRHRRVIIFAA